MLFMLFHMYFLSEFWLPFLLNESPIYVYYYIVKNYFNNYVNTRLSYGYDK